MAKYLHVHEHQHNEVGKWRPYVDSPPPILSDEAPGDLHAVVEEGNAMLVLGIPDVGRHFVSVEGHELREHRARGGQVDDPWPAVLHHDVDLPFDALVHAVVTCIEVHADLAAEAHRLQKGRDPRGTEDLHEVVARDAVCDQAWDSACDPRRPERAHVG